MVLEHIWSALDVDSGEILAVYASWSRNMIVAMKFIRIVLDRCLTKPFLCHLHIIIKTEERYYLVDRI